MKRFSKTISLVLLVFTMIFALAGCSTAPKQDLGDIVPADVPAPVQEETPVAEEPVAEEPVAEEVAVTYVPVEKKYTLFGYELTVVADKGKATITYPASIISEADIAAAAKAAYTAFSGVYDLSEVYYEAKDGVLTIYYPEAWGVEELATAESVVMAQLPAYVESVIASLTTEVEETVTEASEEEEKQLTYEATVSAFGYDINLEAYENVIEITYPSFITFDEIKAAAAAAYEAYPEYLEGSTLYVDSENATAVLTLAAAPSNEDLSYVVSVLDVALPAYVASLFPEEAVEEALEPIELSASISLFGYEASITLKDDVITIDYPDFISVDEVKAAAAAAYQSYSQYLEGSELTIDDGYATLKLAFKLNEDEFYYAVNLLQSELSYYVAYVLGVTEETTEEATEVATEVLESAITFLGQNVSIVAEGNTVTITYPAIITNAEVAAAARAAYEAYSQYLDGSALTIDNGTAVLTLAYDLTADDFNYAKDLLQSQLNSYVASLTETKAEEAVETVTEVAQAVTEAVTKATEEAPAEQPATEAPAAEETKPVETKTETTKPAETKTETTKPAETKTETTTAAEPAKKSNTGLIVLIVVLVVVAAAAVVLFLKKKKN